MSSNEIQAAVEAARRQHGKFVFVPAGATPELRDALTAVAAESGREVLNEPGESLVQRLARETAARDVPAISAGDDWKFIEKLNDIAKGKVKIV